MRTARGLARDNQRTYTSWAAMKARCSNPNAHCWHRYGGRGITICKRWLEGGFEVFLADMGPRPEGTSIDRINPDGNYEPGNCRWANKRMQANNLSADCTEARRQRLASYSARGRASRGARFARIALKRYGRLLGVKATDRLMAQIRADLEEAFGPPPPMEAPREMLCIEEAFIAGDFSQKSDYFDGLENAHLWPTAPALKVGAQSFWKSFYGTHGSAA